MNSTNNKVKKIISFLPFLGKQIYCILLIVIVLALCIVPFFTMHCYMPEFSKWNFVIFGLAGLLIALFLYVYKKFGRRINIWLNQKNRLKNCLIVCLLVLLLLQGIVVVGRAFVTGWEPIQIFYPNSSHDWYYSIYPNNLFLRGLVLLTTNSIVQWVADLCCFLFPQYADMILSTKIETINYLAWVLLNVVLVWTTVLLISLVSKRHFSAFATLMICLFSSLFVGLMPWILVPYSDTTTMFCVAVVIWAYSNIKRSFVKYPLIFIFIIIGFNIKPTIIFLLLAIIFVEICKFFICSKSKKQILKTLKVLGITVLSSVLCLSLVLCIKGIVPVNIDKEKEFTATHFLMLGLNDQSQGLFSQSDVDLSDSASSVEEREEKNLAKCKERFEKLGVGGVFELYGLKTLANYGDGSFMWERDGNFYVSEIGQNQLVKWIYQNYHVPFQVLWFLVLIGCCFVVQRRRAIALCENKIFRLDDSMIYVFGAALLMQTMFLAIFECGARYLILYLPAFILLAAFGFRQASKISLLNKNNYR